MTIQEMKTSTKEILTPADIASVLCVDPQRIRIQVEEDPSKLGFPVSKIGTRVKIPRLGFLRWLEGENGLLSEPKR